MINYISWLTCDPISLSLFDLHPPHNTQIIYIYIHKLAALVGVWKWFFKMETLGNDIDATTTTLCNLFLLWNRAIHRPSVFCWLDIQKSIIPIDFHDAVLWWDLHRPLTVEEDDFYIYMWLDCLSYLNDIHRVLIQ